MPRNARSLAVAAVAIVTFGVPALLVWNELPPQTEPQVLASEDGARMPVAFPAGSGIHTITVETPHFPEARGARIEVEVATYTRAPSQTVAVRLQDGRGRSLRSCRIPPTDCPYDRPAQVRQIAISVKGPEPFALYAVRQGGKLVAGSLVHDYRFASFGARFAALRERVAVTRPMLYSPAILLVCLIGSIALFGAAWIVAAGSRE
jgi:hypothetical protein